MILQLSLWEYCDEDSSISMLKSHKFQRLLSTTLTDTNKLLIIFYHWLLHSINTEWRYSYKYIVHIKSCGWVMIRFNVGSQSHIYLNIYFIIYENIMLGYIFHRAKFNWHRVTFTSLNKHSAQYTKEGCICRIHNSV